MDLDEELVLLILARYPTFTADDITVLGRLAVDPTHAPNGRQSAIGSAFGHWAKRGLIEWTGRVERSRNPHRKGGMIRVWTPTDKGKAWADTWKALNRQPSS